MPSRPLAKGRLRPASSCMAGASCAATSKATSSRSSSRSARPASHGSPSTIAWRPDHRWPACAEDVATAIRWVRAHAKEYKVDVNRIALIGESAGGHLVSWVGTEAKGDTAVAAVVPFYAPHDLEFQVEQRGELGPSMTALLGLTELNDEARAKLRAASPSSRVHAGMPPYLLIHGDADAQVPYEQSPRFQKLMDAAGNRCDLIKVTGGAHGMGRWAEQGSDYQEQLIAWLRSTMK
ncbi:MAG: hypothetical protein C0483_22445 [Pirellula sp.]|nr:hypothetical protein [Pirellula sp.]